MSHVETGRNFEPAAGTSTLNATLEFDVQHDPNSDLPPPETDLHDDVYDPPIIVDGDEMELPPQYDSRGRLVRTTPRTSRYDIARRAELSHRPIPPGPVDDRITNDRPSPRGWHKIVHPEGQLYFYHPECRTVTETFLHQHLLLEKVNFWMDRVKQLAAAQSVDVPRSSELFLELDDDDNSCKYYLVDHATRRLFWLDGGPTSDVGLYPVSSDDHMRIQMESQYWNHVELFPNHIKLSPSVEFEVRGRLTHTAVDVFTSDQSTAPYTMEQCQNFLGLLRDLPTTQETNPFKNCVMARLMAEFSSNRFVNHAGELSARLSRTQTLLDSPTNESNTLLRSLYRLCFQLPREHENRLDDLWVDEISLSSHWRKFMVTRVGEWREQTLWGFGLAMWAILSGGAARILISGTSFNSGLFLAPDSATNGTMTRIGIAIFRVGGIFAEILSLGVVIASLALVKRHQPFIESHAADASSYLSKSKHAEFGFKPLAVVYSVPATLLRYSFISTAVALLSLPWKLGTPLMGIAGLLAFLVVGSAIYYLYGFFRDPNEQPSWTLPIDRWFPFPSQYQGEGDDYTALSGEMA